MNSTPLSRLTGIIADYQRDLETIAREFTPFQILLRNLPNTVNALPTVASLFSRSLPNVIVGGVLSQAMNVMEILNRKNFREAAAKDRLDSAWNKATKEIAAETKTLYSRQPRLAEVASEIYSEKMPTSLAFGSVSASFETLSCEVPHLLDFPFKNALLLPEKNDSPQQLAHHFLLRLLSAIPPGRLEVSIVDSRKSGQSVAPFLPLLSCAQIVPQKRVLTRSDEIEEWLNQLTTYTEDVIQKRFQGRVENWTSYNAANPGSQLNYRVLLLFDVPEQLSDKSILFLSRLVENGPKCGVLPILAVEDKRIEDRRFSSFCDVLKTNAVGLNSLLPGNNNASQKNLPLSLKYTHDSWPAQDHLDAFLAALAKRCADATRFAKTLSDLWAERSKGSTATDGIQIPIGWTDAGEVVSVAFGAVGSIHHALLAGKTGSGKSNLLHVLIHSLCEKYSPQEIDIYLLDYKESIEFSVYAEPPLPHARLVATESDPEYGITVLEHLATELEDRSAIFKAASVRDYAEYRKSTKAHLPRALLVIDEFQVLFGENREVTEKAEKLLGQLLKQGRSFGIHVLLSTQTLKGLSTLSLGALTSQLGCRIALACGQEDSALILGGNNLAASEIKSPPEAILNTANGAKSENTKFRIPLAEKETCRQHLATFSAKAKKGEQTKDTKIFNGANLPALPTPAHFQHALSEIGSETLLLGDCLTFNAEALHVPLITRTGGNLLVCGFDYAIHDGLLISTLLSMAALSAFEEVVYFNARGISPQGLDFAVEQLGKRLRCVNEIAALPLHEIAENIGKKRTALIIDGLDEEKALHPASPYNTRKLGEPPSPGDLLKRIAEEGPRKGTFVFAFVFRWQRCAGLSKDLFSFFEMRIAFGMNEDDAGTFVSAGGIGKLKGVEKTNRAVFINRLKSETAWFRPYIFTETTTITTTPT
jgi:hypothetical protein